MSMEPEQAEYRVVIHAEEGSYWAEVEQMPGLFASGDTQEELQEALVEAMGMYLSSSETHVRVQISSIEPVSEVVDARVLVG